MEAYKRWKAKYRTKVTHPKVTKYKIAQHSTLLLKYGPNKKGPSNATKDL